MRRFEVFYPYYHDSWDHCVVVRAYDHESAAETFAEEDDQQGDYSIIGAGESEVIWVREEGSLEEQKFIVFAENQPVYRAKEVK